MPKRKSPKKSRPQKSRPRQVKAKRYHLLAIAGLVVGIQLMLASGWYLLYRRTILSFQVSPSVVSEIRKEAPAQIRIEGTVQIEVPVTQGVIKEGIWEVSDTSVVHLATSAYPEQPGNIIMYGHNTKHIFKNLPSVKPGDTITLATESHLERRYTVTEVMTVDPTDIEVVLPTDYEVLTVYTCTGLFDSKRFVVKARPITT
jgi:LPXTG-site transpeptidase (sortase) family protein